MLVNAKDVHLKDLMYFNWQLDYLKGFLFKDILYKDADDTFHCQSEKLFNWLFTPYRHMHTYSEFEMISAFLYFPFFVISLPNADGLLYNLSWTERYMEAPFIVNSSTFSNRKFKLPESYIQAQLAYANVLKRTALFESFIGKSLYQNFDYQFKPELQKPFETWLITSGNSVNFPVTACNLDDEFKYGEISSSFLIHLLNDAMSIWMTILSGLAFFYKLAVNLPLTDTVRERWYRTFKYAMDSLQVIDELYTIMLKYEIPIYKDYVLSPPYSEDVDFKKVHPDYLWFPGCFTMYLLPGSPWIIESYWRAIPFEEVFSNSREALIRSIIDSVLEIPHMGTLISSFMIFDKEKPSASVEEYLYSYINPLSTDTLRYLLVNPLQTVETLNRLYQKLYRKNEGVIL